MNVQTLHMNPLAYLESTSDFYSGDEDVVEPQESALHCEGLLLTLVCKHLPSARCRAIVHETSPASDGDEPAIGAQGRISYGPVRRHVALGDLDMLPYIRFGVDDAHIWLVRTAIDKNAIIHLKEPVLGVVLPRICQRKWMVRSFSGRTGECCPVVALLANGRTNICPSGSARDVRLLA